MRTRWGGGAVIAAALLGVLGCKGKPLPPGSRLLVLAPEGAAGEQDWIKNAMPVWVVDALASAPLSVIVLPASEVEQPTQPGCGTRRPPPGEPSSPADLAKKLGAAAVLSGEVERRKDGFALTLTLRGSDGSVRGHAKVEASSAAEVPRAFVTLRGRLERVLGLDLPEYVPGTSNADAFRSLLSARSWMARDSERNAKRHLETATRTDPQLAAAWIELGTLAAERGDRQAALAAHHSGAARKERLPALDRARLDLLGARVMDDPIEVERATSVLLALAPGDPVGRRVGARLARGRLDVTRQRSLLEGVARAWPSHRGIAVELSEALVAEGKAADAQRTLEALTDANQVDSAVHDARGYAAAAAGDLAAADAHYVKAQDAGFSGARLGRAWIALQRGDVAGAELQLAQLDGSLRDHGEALVAAARGQCGRARQAAVRYVEAEAQGGGKTASQVLAARVALSCREPALALELLRDADGKRPGRAALMAVTLRGLAAQAAGDEGQVRTALAALEEVRRIRGVDTSPLAALIEGRAALARGDKDLALEQARKAARLRQEGAAALLTAVLAARQDWAECGRAGTEVVPDTQWPGEVSGMEGLVPRWSSALECLERAGKPEAASALRARITKLGAPDAPPPKRAPARRPVREEKRG